LRDSAPFLVLHDRPVRVPEYRSDLIVEERIKEDSLRSVDRQPIEVEIAELGGDPPNEVGKRKHEGIERFDSVHLGLLLDELDVLLRPEDQLVLCPGALEEAEVADDVDCNFNGIRTIRGSSFLKIALNLPRTM
jgi:hypothetical protein